MKTSYLIFAVAIIGLTVFGFSHTRADDAYIMAADEFGNSYFMALNDNGVLSDQVLVANTGYIPYAIGVGDFDNDEDFDYIVANGLMAGTVHLIEKLNTGNQFALPVVAASWSGAYFPGKIAVADFNGDTNLDFVLTQYYSDAAHLYLGDGNLGFGQPILLPGTTPFDSLAADAADFDNDGFFDFVSAPSDHSNQMLLNFGDGHGGFTTVPLDCHDYTLYSGIAAADFNGDGHVDLAASATGVIDFYWGDGNRGFAYGARITDSKIWDSPMESYDINGDRNQDLILGSYGDSTTSTGDVVAVFMGDGLGGFGTPDIYVGGDGNLRIAIAALAPPKALPNGDPVAVIEPNELNVEVGQPAEFSAAASYDPDGEIVNFNWDFGDAKPAAVLAVASMAAPVADGNTVSHVFREPGDYTITLTVTDDKGAANSITAVAHVAAPKPKIEGRAIFRPKTLNLKSKGRWVKAYIKLPQQYRGAELNGDRLYLVDPVSGEQIAAASYVRYKKWWRVYVVKFDRQAIISHIGETEKHVTWVPLQVEGELSQEDGMAGFEANGEIKAYNPNSGKKDWRSFRKQIMAACWNYRR
jgi:PKD repeat protein